ncbi:DUF4328 domain-containing protein [Amycolatopsis sp. YIM 10]|uniref:DUF4328 domain-containing protein n=1 Tax=Amycolatopsis sp. YIM 10 TaxID=2653857 RepID=UPI001D144F83|nr:DUF4328 domain-containing protein [Amycolatopsis sp. YIM 10]
MSVHPQHYPPQQQYQHRPPMRQRVRWVATPPYGPAPRRRAVDHRYYGPPAYRVPPRWGFPNVVWRLPTAVPGTPSNAPRPAQRLRALSRNATVLLWVLAGFAAVAALAEGWRYVLLLVSRDSALDADLVGASDALVLTAALLTFLLALFAAGISLWWLLVARVVAADELGERPPRPPWQVLVGFFVPGPNLVMAGSIVAETEHAVLRRPGTERPRPSRLVLAWWGTWALNGVLLVVSVIWRLRDGVQAQADGVLLAVLTDGSAAGLAVLTALLVRRMTGLLAPVGEDKLRHLRVLSVSGAPEPELRPARPATAPR